MSEDEPRWVPHAAVRTLHASQIREHGGSLGVRDEGLLESALDRPRNRWHYGDETATPALAAAYGFGIAKNYPFIDGNKRTAFQVMYVFLGLNGHSLDATEPEVVELMESVAGGSVGEDALAAWLTARLTDRA